MGAFGSGGVGKLRDVETYTPITGSNADYEPYDYDN